jgi:hypothetical protein
MGFLQLSLTTTLLASVVVVALDPLARLEAIKNKFKASKVSAQWDVLSHIVGNVDRTTVETKSAPQAAAGLALTSSAALPPASASGRARVVKFSASETKLADKGWTNPFHKNYTDRNILLPLLERAYQDVGSKYSGGSPACKDLYELIIKTFNPGNRPTHEAERKLTKDHARAFVEKHGLVDESMLHRGFIMQGRPFSFFQLVGAALHRTRQRLGVTHIKGQRQFPPGYDGAPGKPVGLQRAPDPAKPAAAGAEVQAAGSKSATAGTWKVRRAARLANWKRKMEEL